MAYHIRQTSCTSNEADILYVICGKHPICTYSEVNILYALTYFNGLGIIAENISGEYNCIGLRITGIGLRSFNCLSALF